MSPNYKTCYLSSVRTCLTFREPNAVVSELIDNPSICSFSKTDYPVQACVGLDPIPARTWQEAGCATGRTQISPMCRPFDDKVTFPSCRQEPRSYKHGRQERVTSPPLFSFWCLKSPNCPVTGSRGNRTPSTPAAARRHPFSIGATDARERGG